MPEVVIRKRCLELIEEAREGSERCLRYPMRYFSLYALLFSHKKVHILGRPCLVTWGRLTLGCTSIEAQNKLQRVDLSTFSPATDLDLMSDFDVDVHFLSLLFPIHSSPLFSLLSSQPNSRSSERVPNGLSFCRATCHKQQDQSSSFTSPSFRRVVWSVFGRSLTASRSSQDEITTKSRWCRFQEVNPSTFRL